MKVPICVLDNAWIYRLRLAKAIRRESNYGPDGTELPWMWHVTYCNGSPVLWLRREVAYWRTSCSPFSLSFRLVDAGNGTRYWTTERPRAGTSNYQAVRRACRERGLLFEDPDFPPGPRALYHHKKPPLHPIVWMRPSEMCQRPKFIADGTGGNRAEGSRFDVEPGELGDTWLLAAVSSLTLTPRFLDRVVPPEQNFDNTTYCGLFSHSAKEMSSVKLGFTRAAVKIPGFSTSRDE
uniref:Calpain catalytic domain-containing protein n=1 Tax=Timema shepardi TaxID=629360 RepID=A0A7R9AMD0_TIMSH|nr:unnamed protein product [Timema shepardi]